MGKLINRYGRQLALLATAITIAACGKSSSSPPPPPPPATVAISGILTYEFPQPFNNCQGLDLDNPLIRPIRQATVQLLDAGGTNLLASMVSNDSGAYSFNVGAATDFIIRVRAELKSADWDVEVRNNVDTSGSPPPLGQRPIYALDFPFNSGTSDNPNVNPLAATGWTGGSYTGTRAAAPFAILDTIYTAMRFVAAEDPTANFTALDAFWSPDNKTASPTDLAAGDLPTTFYSVGASQLFLLGLAGVDTDEFDDQVVVHEWGHYFEDKFSRTDSFGGSHARGDLLDSRLAFSEGWASALSAMSLDNPAYCDTFGGSSGFGWNAESSRFGPDGWFNEQTVIRLIYDLWDTDPDIVADTSSIGFGPIYNVMAGPQSTTEAFTSIFAFATYLKQQGTGQDAFIDALLTDSGINPTGIDIWGSTEQNASPGTPDDVLPVYTPLTLGVTETICVNSQFDSGREGNKLSEHRYLRLNLASAAQVTFSMIANPAPSQPTGGFDCTADPSDPENSEHSDPDFLVLRNGQISVFGWSCAPNSEIVASSGSLSAGDFVIDINEFRHEDDNSPAGFPERVCFDFTAN